MQLCRYLQLILTLGHFSLCRVSGLPDPNDNDNNTIKRLDALHLASISIFYLADAIMPSPVVPGEYEAALFERASGRIGLAGHGGAQAMENKVTATPHEERGRT
jgi:hypothetical protein